MANRATAGKNRPIKMWCWGMRQEKMDIKINVFTGLAAEPCILENKEYIQVWDVSLGTLYLMEWQQRTLLHGLFWAQWQENVEIQAIQQKVKVFCFFFYCEGSQTQEWGCPEKLWTLCSWRYSKHKQGWHWTACSGWFCCQKEGLDPPISRGACYPLFIIIYLTSSFPWW